MPNLFGGPARFRLTTVVKPISSWKPNQDRKENRGAEHQRLNPTM